MKAHNIVALLKDKHAEDVFLPECKDGPTQGTTHFRLDGWAMQKSWARPTTWGYEVKVSRSDFVGDDKWQNYLDLCSDFYFVCPDGLIQPSEVPDAAGLLWVAKTGTRLWTKKKAPRREVCIPETMWRYIVMRLHSEQPADKLAFWQEWIAAKEQSLDVGHRVSRRLRELISENITRVELESKRVKAENEKLEAVKTACAKLGINLHVWDVEREVAEVAAQRKQVLSPTELTTLKQARASLDRFLTLVERAT